MLNNHCSKDYSFTQENFGSSYFQEHNLKPHDNGSNIPSVIANNFTNHHPLFEDYTSSDCQEESEARLKILNSANYLSIAKQFSCPYCGKQCARNSILQQHIRVHTDALQNASFSRFQSEEMKKRGWYSVKAINSHLGFNIYSFRGRYKCSFCSMDFNQRSHLHQHLRTHTGERPYVCNICKAAFTQKGRLTIHYRTHTGERPFKCEICSYSAAQSSDLKRHIISKHKL